MYLTTQDDKLHAVDGASGAVRWSLSVPGSGGAFVSLGSDGTVYLAGSGTILAVDSASRTLLWSFPAPGGVNLSDVAIGFDSVLYLGGSDGTLYALGP